MDLDLNYNNLFIFGLGFVGGILVVLTFPKKDPDPDAEKERLESELRFLKVTTDLTLEAQIRNTNDYLKRKWKKKDVRRIQEIQTLRKKITYYKKRQYDPRKNPSSNKFKEKKKNG